MPDPSTLRSHRWFGPDDLRSFGHRSRLKGMGLDDEDYRGKPIVAILNTWSDLNTCHSHFKTRVEDVRRGILQAGGFPVEIPVMSLGEMMMKPTTMFYRNLLAMETEEVLRCHPVDAAVLMGGCDKTVPAMLMGALSADIPSIFMPAGPMLKARWKNETLGSGSDSWKFWAERCAGSLCDRDWFEIENCIARSAGTCMTMGTASTMAAVSEALGFTLPGAACIPAVVAEHSRLAVASGRRAVAIAWENLRPSRIASRKSFENAVRTALTTGGSTNAIVHLIAMAGRAGVELTLDDFDALSRETPVLADLRPAGRFLMEDLFNAGGVPALLEQIRHLLHLDCQTVGGMSLGEQIAGAGVIDSEVIRPLDRPVSPTGGTCVLRGNLAPGGSVIKGIAAEPRLLKHTGPALVFDDYADLKARVNDPDLPVTADTVMVLRTAGPVGAPGMPEWGMLPIPKKLLEQGVRDLVRISDARMSGTSYGACVLHVAPESWVGGPLALVEDGDLIELDVESRRLHWHVSDEEAARRRANWKPRASRFERGYGKLHQDHVSQADQGCDFDFLRGRSPESEPDIH
ncbi:L-arabinonate dehydratase [Candidatus Laterigemmans baculatus]|uniref:L-arabinonate dehydratase n=1 Tax=Candidatus Laterigemmans baculatus TaxID=2770505 RepID=UPI0013D9DC98|nr:L-arabinonate dehydratase [Candidatus Laterigemmans baculatus]